MCDYTGNDIFEEIATIRDPERTYASLADLNVVSPDRCSVSYLIDPGMAYDTLAGACESQEQFQLRRRRRRNIAVVTVTLLPTVPHCHLMHLICLSVVCRLRDTLPVTTSWKVVVKVVPHSHLQWEEVERQANDKERVAAAFDNPTLLKEVHKLTNPFGAM